MKSIFRAYCRFMLMEYILTEKEKKKKKLNLLQEEKKT